MPNSELQRINSFLSTFARRQAARVVDLPGGFVVYDDAFAYSRANNQVIIDTAVDFEAAPAIAEEALGHLPHRLISVFDDEAGTVCAEPLIRAGYTHSTYLVMLHAGPVPACGSAEELDLDAIRVPLTRRWRGLLPDVDDEVIRHLVDRREARRRGADIVHFFGARTEEGETASWADLYLDQATGIAQIEGLTTSGAHLKGQQPSKRRHPAARTIDLIPHCNQLDQSRPAHPLLITTTAPGHSPPSPRRAWSGRAPSRRPRPPRSRPSRSRPPRSPRRRRPR